MRKLWTAVVASGLIAGTAYADEQPVTEPATAHTGVFDQARDDVAMSQEATRLFDEGRDAVKRGDYPGACGLFERSLQITRALGTQLNYADCLEHTNQLRRAWEQFREVEALAREREQLPRAHLAKDRITALELRLATVVVEVADPKASSLVVLIDNRSVRIGNRIVERNDPGTIEVTAVTTEGRHTQKVTLRSGAVTTVVIPPIVRSEPIAALVDHGRPRKRAALLVGAGGLALWAGAFTVSIYGSRRYQDGLQRRDAGDFGGVKQANDASDLVRYYGTGLFLAGSVTVGVATYLYLTARSPEIVGQTAVVPTFGGDAVGLAMSGGF